MEELLLEEFTTGIDYTESIELLQQELLNLRELQVMQLNNSIEMYKVLIIFFAFLVACIIGLYLVRVAFR